MKYEKGKCYKVLVGMKEKDGEFKYTGDFIVLKCEENSDDLKGTIVGHSPNIGKVSEEIEIFLVFQHCFPEYNETLFDKLYNWYNRQMKRNDEYV